MGPRIAMLLSGSLSDVSVGICAVKLAARTDSKIYAIQDPYKIGLHHCRTPRDSNDSCSTEFPLQESLRFITELTGNQRVPLSCYSLEEEAKDPLGDILIEQAISCLVLYTGNQTRQTGIPWLELLQERLNDSPRWFQGDLLIVMAPPWKALEAEKALVENGISI